MPYTTARSTNLIYLSLTMPKTARTNRKRQGKHHRHTKHYVKVYAPYLPLLVSIIASLFLNFWRPTLDAHRLAYATEMSRSGLLGATNSKRVAAGVGSLALNSKLNSAAQAKANDMIARDYWSHTTPDGQEPWIFIEAAGYQYTKAGENLAYGFATSASAVDGWMGSPSHKANMLDSVFTDVGFGFANGEDFNESGEQTVVVAMYGKPYVLPATTQPSTPAPVEQAPEPEPEPAPAPAPKPEPAPQPEPEVEPEPEPEPVNTEQPVATTLQPEPVNRSQLLAFAPWTLGAVTFMLGSVLLFRLLHIGLHLKRSLAHHPKLRHLLFGSERFIMHHPLLDSTILGLSILAYTLSRVVGVIL